MAEKSRDGAKERPSTYFVEDRMNPEEAERVTIQDEMITTSMGGVLPEQADPANLRNVLDVGCGTGGWLINVAKTYPVITTLIGVDISNRIIAHAREQAEVAGVTDRVEFHVMDALRMLEFPQGYFDLVNQRMGFSYLRTWDWPKLLQEYRRVTRGGGTIRITESDIFGEDESPTLMRLFALARDAFYESGHLFVAGRQGVTSALPALMQRHGVMDVQTRKTMIHYDVNHEAYRKDVRLILRTIRPFLQKWTRVPDDYEQLCQQALAEMERPDFNVAVEFVTVWGKNPEQEKQEHFN